MNTNTNNVIILAVVAALAWAAVGLIAATADNMSHRHVEIVRPAPPEPAEVDFEFLDFFTPGVEELITEDPDGWAELIEGEEPASREAIKAWTHEIRQRLFERKYGHRYNLEN